MDELQLLSGNANITARADNSASENGGVPVIVPEPPRQATTEAFTSLMAESDNEPLSENEALFTLARHWDDLNGSDDIVSRDDLVKVAADPSQPTELRAATQFFLDNEAAFERLDTASEGGGTDSRVIDADLSARLSNIPLTAEDEQALTELSTHWDDINGRDDIVSLNDLKEIADDSERPAALRAAAQHLLDHRELTARLDTSGENGSFDGKISTGDMSIYTPLTEADEEALTTLAENWDQIRDGDQIVSKDDLEEIADDSSQPDELREAAQHLLDSPVLLRTLDTAGSGGGGDDKISSFDMAKVYYPESTAEQQLRQDAIKDQIENGPLGDARLNEIQQTTSHNSYETQNLSLTDQFNQQGIHSFELDIHNGAPGIATGDSVEGDWDVYHDTTDRGTTVPMLSDGLAEIEALDNDAPITLFVDLKDGFDADSGHSPEDLDRLLERELGDKLFTPQDWVDSVEGADTFEEAIEIAGWPTAEDLQGKVLVVLTGGDAEGKLGDYAGDAESAADRSAFIAPKPQFDEDGNHIVDENAVFYNTSSIDDAATVNEGGFVTRVYGLEDQDDFEAAREGGVNFLGTDYYDPTLNPWSDSSGTDSPSFTVIK